MEKYRFASFSGHEPGAQRAVPVLERGAASPPGPAAAPARRLLKLLVMTDTAVLGAGGSQRFLRNLLGRLPGDEYAVDVLQLSPPPDPASRVGDLDGAPVRLLHRPVDAVYGPRGLAAYADVRRRVARGDYDIVQSQHEKSDLLCSLLPRVAGVRRISNRRDMGFNKSARVRALLRRTNARFDRIVAPSRCILDALVADENAIAERCIAIPNGVDTRRFRPLAPDARARLRAGLGFAADDFLIGCVASLTPVKRHDVLIDAFARVRRACPAAHLLLVGDGPLRPEVEARVAASGLGAAVHLLGACAEVENLLPALDAFVLASSTEGLSNAILEAQACGVAVVATAVGGNCDLVVPGQSGLLVPCGDAEALAAALIGLARQPQQRADLAAAALRQVETTHSLAAMTAAYRRLYRELADGL